MIYILYKFGCNRSITKGTLLEKESTFLAVSRLLFKWSIWNYKLFTYCVCNNHGISCLLSVRKKGTLLEEQNTFSTVSRLLFEGSVSHSKLITYCERSTHDISLVAIGQLRKSIYLKKKYLLHCMSPSNCPVGTNSLLTNNQHWFHIAANLSHFLRSRWRVGVFHWDDCCLVSASYPNTQDSSPVVMLEMKLGSSSARSLSLVQTVMCSMLTSSDKIRWHVSYDSPTML